MYFLRMLDRVRNTVGQWIKCSFLPLPKHFFITLTFSHHADVQTLHEAAGLAGLPSTFGDLTFIGGGAAVLNVSCGDACREKEQRVFNDCQQNFIPIAIQQKIAYNII